MSSLNVEFFFVSSSYIFYKYNNLLTNHVNQRVQFLLYIDKSYKVIDCSTKYKYSNIIITLIKIMKGNQYRLMKVFDIQNDYQRHKDRLLSIRNLDTKKKVTYSTTKNISVINNYKKNRLTSDIFMERQKISKLGHQNSMMHTNLSKVYKRDPNKTLRHDSSKASLRSISSNNSRIKIKEQNKKMKNKISATKSTYSNFRKNSQPETIQSRRPSYNSKSQLVNLLENQLGIKPRVVFPYVKKRNLKVQNRQNNTLRDISSFDQRIQGQFHF